MLFPLLRPAFRRMLDLPLRGVAQSVSIRNDYVRSLRAAAAALVTSSFLVNGCSEGDSAHDQSAPPADTSVSADVHAADADQTHQDGTAPEDATEDVVLDVAEDTPEPPPIPPNGPAPDYLPVAAPGRHDVRIVTTRQIIPDPMLPAEAPAQNSNNNLDVVRHSDGRVYLAWRTAPDHFASPEARMHVLSSDDEQTWQWEASFARATDLREPRFLSYDGRLWLYLAELGTNRLSFDPQGMLVSARDPATGTWGDLMASGPPGFIPWRAQVVDGVPLLIGYTGGENIYRFNLVPLDIHLLTTTDGVNWEGLDNQQPVVERGGGSEAAFAIDDDNRLWAVVRNEAGDDSGWGSKLCSTPPARWWDWTCRYDPRKYDSPLVFAYDGELYLVGRRNVTPDGFYDLGMRDQTPVSQVLRYQADYTTHPKRCSLWRIDRTEERVRFLLDLPSAGDTCFPSILALEEEGRFALYNYSSPPQDGDPSWRQGQDGPTRIYRHELAFTRR